ncbi:hypothetical protein ILUMI_08436 [Ignelater luminosus]|uniref:Endonuclease/exonuclease/phosphatase family domain-containing protein 1 n=1 Tax=Ignelater luminosus TaxID=2038154 RepID=A0A8K0D1N1_IGNLU|nr:hypothetical protein ILUMI_08436 [Ignelater luminosus]
MGQNHSSVSMPKRISRKSLRSPFTRRSSKLNLSATFTMTDDDHKIELLNINLATEEELMTLPGINRAIARNIVEHRKAIGRFKKVEDLALVKGIGADKLDQIRPEICVNKRKTQSCSSSRAQSLDSLDSRVNYRTNKLVDINKASVFELQCVHGLTQELAANIVDYRTKKGPFRHLDDVIKVKGINQMHLGNIRPYLTISTLDEPKRPVSELITINGGMSNGGFHTPINHRKSPSAPIKFSLSNGLSASSISDIFELLSAYSYRPIPEEEFCYERNGEKALRIASWNLQNLTLEKVQNLGVREVICRTILENRWSIIAVQEIQDVEALKLVCDALNKPHLRRIAEWKNNSRQWNFCMSDLTQSQLGFLYDACSGDIGVGLSSLGQTNVDDCQVALAEFKVGNIELSLLNVYLPSHELDNLEQKLKQAVGGEDSVLFLMGDFTNISKKAIDETGEIAGFQAVLPFTINTNCLSVKSSINCRFSDNILTNKGGQSQLTGVWGVVRQGLTHLAIPWGWNWGGPASTHCPVWAEIYASPNIGTAL